MAVPQVKKVVLNMGVGVALKDKTQLDKAAQDLAQITGQKPLVTKAHKSVAGFKLRQGQAIGLKVTLRGKRMYDFLEKLFRIVLPRLRDFQGLSLSGFDGYGNYNLGIKEQIVFPEIDYGKIDRVRGLQISIVTTAPNDQVARRLLSLMGAPFAKSNKSKS